MKPANPKTLTTATDAEVLAFMARAGLLMRRKACPADLAPLVAELGALLKLWVSDAKPKKRKAGQRGKSAVFVR